MRIYMGNRKLMGMQHSKLEKSMMKTIKEYATILDLWDKKEIDKHYKDDHLTAIFNESLYDNAFDLLYDVQRYRMGLPVFIQYVTMGD